MSANGRPNGGNQSAAEAGAATTTSVLRFEHVVRKTSPGYSVDVRVLDQLDAYAEYIGGLIGKAPTKDEVVEKALAHVFGADAGFKRFLSAGGGGRAAAGVKKSNGSSSAGAAATPPTAATQTA